MNIALTYIYKSIYLSLNEEASGEAHYRKSKCSFVNYWYPVVVIRESTK